MRSTATCTLCGRSFSKSGITRHLRACLPKHDGADEEPRTLLHVRVEQSYRGSPYFLDLEVDGTVRLRFVDAYLRRLWLECCGHLSGFRLPWGQSVGESRTLAEALAMGDGSLGYDYDFGSTTSLVLRRVGVRHGTGDGPLRLLARNDPPAWSCDTCGAPATQVCSMCWGEDAFFCDEHAQEHPCWRDDGLLPVVNSPRMGVCGYTGEEG